MAKTFAERIMGDITDNSPDLWSPEYKEYAANVPQGTQVLPHTAWDELRIAGEEQAAYNAYAQRSRDVAHIYPLPFEDWKRIKAEQAAEQARLDTAPESV